MISGYVITAFYEMNWEMGIQTTVYWGTIKLMEEFWEVTAYNET